MNSSAENSFCSVENETTSMCSVATPNVPSSDVETYPISTNLKTDSATNNFTTTSFDDLTTDSCVNRVSNETESQSVQDPISGLSLNSSLTSSVDMKPESRGILRLTDLTKRAVEDLSFADDLMSIFAEDFDMFSFLNDLEENYKKAVSLQKKLAVRRV